MWRRAGGSAAGGAGDAGTLRQLALAAGCRLVEVYQSRPTNPPTSGDFRERDRIPDGDYSRSDRPPPLRGTVHALKHGYVLLQYRPGLGEPALARLRRLYEADPAKTLVFENQTGMPYEVAVTAYLSAVVCPRFSEEVVPVLDAFRTRRRGFRQDL